MTFIGRGKNDVVQRRDGQDRWFGKEKRARFLDELEASCNVTRAAAAAGISRASAHRLRRNDPAFAEQWTLAIDAGCERIRAELLARALGTADPADNDEHPGDGDRTVIAAAPMSDETKLKVLQICRAAKEGRMNNPTRRYPLGSRSPEEALASFIAKLERVERDVAGRE